ncbi:MAG TPA: 4-hydroxybenzoate 3-monooxygenase, partial [Xanthobacteraceae bacterium]|nr:4-hydroxybenzoate 3-monooxygenase [Xanthobacteraceae bacterium]
MRTQVAIVGAGPAGLLLSHLLKRNGIESVILENRSRRYVVQRVRAGLLEQGTVDLMTELGLADRLHRKGLVHEGLALRFSGQSHRIPLTELTGKVVTIYGQNEVMKDLIDARLAAGGEILFEAEAKALEGRDSKTPRVRFRHNGRDDELTADFIAGCDGFHGMCRPAIPADALTIYDREYPFAWLGILSESPPISRELIYVHHARGFALFTMRSPVLSRLYLQCTPDEDIANWPDARIWEEL